MKVKETLIFVDLDNTIIDSGKVNKMVNKTVCKVTGCSSKEWENYCGFVNDGHINNFPKCLIEFCKDKKVGHKKIYEQLEYRKLVFTNAINTLIDLRKGGTLILFTEGEFTTQKIKIDQLGLKKYFDKLIISENKIEELEKLQLEGKNLVFIDDKPKIVKAIKEKYQAKVFWINNGYYPAKLSDFKIKPDFVVSSITQVPELLR